MNSNEVLDNYKKYKKYLERRGRLIDYLDNKPEAGCLKSLCSFLEGFSYRFFGCYWELKPEDVEICEDQIKLKYSWREGAEARITLPIWFVDDPEKFFNKKAQEDKEKRLAKEEEDRLVEEFRKSLRKK